MMDDDTPAADDPNPAEPSGGLGGEPERPGAVGTVDPRNGARDIRLIERAVKQGWLIPERAFYSLPEVLTEIGENNPDVDGEKPYTVENQIRAARTVVLMHRTNQLGEKTDGPASPGVTVNVNVAVATARELLDDPGYLDYQRQRALAADASLVCPDGDARPAQPVANGKAPGPDRSGSNGHHHGTNGADVGH